MGENFGNDKSQVSVIIGNKPATVITVSNTRIYCFVPPQAYDGSIKVIVGAGRDQKQVSAKRILNMSANR